MLPNAQEKKMILLDRDNTINQDPGYIRHPDEIKLLPHVVEGLRLLKNFGFIFAVVTNQSGIGRGYLSQEDLQHVHNRLSEILRGEGIEILDYFVCPHTPQDDCHCRKPKSGLVKQALQKYNLQPHNAYIVGDRLRDIQAAEYADIAGILIASENMESTAGANLPTNLLYQAKNFKDAADFIVQHEFEKFIRSKIFSQAEISSTRWQKFWQSQAKKKIIFTNGCFDVLHPGHVQYLWQAAQLGDILLVGLNSDASVKNLKGESRPINAWQDRALLLASLQSVGAVIEFGESTPQVLLQKICPHVHVKGGDYVAQNLPEYELLKNMGAEIVILPFRQGYSTTGFLQKILSP